MDTALANTQTGEFTQVLASIPDQPASIIDDKRVGKTAGKPQGHQDFVKYRLGCTRTRLRELDRSLKELNAMPVLAKGREAAIKAVAGAMKDLQEIERQLAGRPLPPTLKGEARLVAKTRAQQLLSGE